MDKICKIESDFKKPNKDDIILSASLFKLNDMYKCITVYVDGLSKIINFIINENNIRDKNKFFLFIYIDHSVIEDSDFNKLYMSIKNLNFISVCKYYCSNYIDINNKLHYGVFGTFIRMLPLFEKDYESNIKTVIDIDYTDREIYLFIKHITNIFAINNNNVVFINKIGYSWKYLQYFKNEYLDDSVLFIAYFKNIYLPIELLTEFLNLLLNKDKDISSVLALLFKDKLELEKEEKLGLCNDRYTSDHLFIYGIDEYFINKLVIDYVIKYQGRFGIIYLGDNLHLYPTNVINVEQSKKYYLINLAKKMLGDKYDLDHDIETNIKLIGRLFHAKQIVDYKKYQKLLNNISKFSYLLNFNKNNIVLNKDWLSNFETHIKHKFLPGALMYSGYNRLKDADYYKICNEIKIYDKMIK